MQALCRKQRKLRGDLEDFQTQLKAYQEEGLEAWKLQLVETDISSADKLLKDIMTQYNTCLELEHNHNQAKTIDHQQDTFHELSSSQLRAIKTEVRR